MTITLPTFHSCPKKLIARKETIINVYRELFHNKVPINKQYWTMCGLHANEDKTFANGSELGQILKEELITEDQFFGIDINPEVIELNKQSKPTVNWINNDLLKEMKKAYFNNNFNPAIINADLIFLQKRGTRFASQILSFLQDTKINNLFIVCNIMLTNPRSEGWKLFSGFEFDTDTTIKEFEKSIAFQYVWNSGDWKLYPRVYDYNGTGKQSRTALRTLIFYKRGTKNV